MAITVGGSSITFPDATTQSTAATGYAGPSSTLYTTAGSGTFTIPTGVTKIKITIVGGGGGAGFTCGPCTTSGGTGGTSSVSSGTQTISTISATGGQGYQWPTQVMYPGLGSGGDINGYGFGNARYFSSGSIFSGAPYKAGNSAGTLGAGGIWQSGNSQMGASGGHAIKWLTGLTPGNTLSYTVGAGGTSFGGSTGGAGVILFEY